MRIKKAMVFKVFLFSILTAGFFLYSCEKYTYEPPGVNPDKDYSFKADILPIFEKNCAMCHPSVHQPDLSDDNAYTSLTDGGYINTDNPEQSKIIEKLGQGHGGFDNTSPEYFDILGWITQGAKNN